jgi:drug/metabolite transporter (DMT)-like permease
MTSAAIGISIVGAGVALSDHLTDYPVLGAQAVRYAIGAGLLCLVGRAGRRGSEPGLGAGDWVRLVAMTMTGMVLFNVAVVRAVTTGEPAVVGTIVGLAPVGVALAVPLLERRRPHANIVVGAALAAAGAAVVEGYGAADLPSLAWSFAALGCEVAFTVLAAPLLRTLSPLGLTVRACLLASLMLSATAVLLEGTDGFARPDAGEALTIVYLAVGSTAVAFVLWYRALAHLGPERTGLMPVSATLVGAAATAAPLGAGTLVGAILAGTGLAVGLGSRSARSAPPAPPRPEPEPVTVRVTGAALPPGRVGRWRPLAAVGERHDEPHHEECAGQAGGDDRGHGP